MSDYDNKRKKSNSSETLKILAYFSQIGVTMGASIIIGVLLGKYLDEWLGTSPWLLLIFSLLGAGAAIKSLLTMPKDKIQ